ncbi:hypothetical protein [Galactobacter sp.]|uniref:hypothetical protein n=1 Tax=Galactobacter sp. TaxID=2676125 RepID=UPI0025BD6541|nr:hypothetical protein [Galactobacter sp.]
MTRYYVRPPDQVEFGIQYVGKTSVTTGRIDLEFEHESFYATFSGYAIPPESTDTVADMEDYYLHGAAGAFDHSPATPEETDHRRDIGLPISGDHTAVFRNWRATGEWPKLRDVWASIGLGPDGLPTKPAEPVQTSIFDLLGTP